VLPERIEHLDLARVEILRPAGGFRLLAPFQESQLGHRREAGRCELLARLITHAIALMLAEEIRRQSQTLPVPADGVTIGAAPGVCDLRIAPTQGVLFSEERFESGCLDVLGTVKAELARGLLDGRS
jgi:hypothetical protein